jgi:hypothetical protein
MAVMKKKSRNLAKNRDANSERLTRYLERYQTLVQGWSGPHSDYREDNSFYDGNQWDARTLQLRKTANLSCLVYNQMTSKVKYIVNNALKNLPGMKCHPISGGANKNTAQVFDGILKYIQYEYDAPDAFVTALRCAVVGGIGAFRWLPTANAAGESDIEFVRITDPTDIVVDTSAKKVNFSDMDDGFISSWVRKDKLKELYGEEVSFDIPGKAYNSMYQDDQVQLLEYWVKNVETGYVEQYIISGSDILEENISYRGTNIPIGIVTGEEYWVDGKRKFKGIIRDNKDIQRLLNLTKSRSADHIGQSSQAQWLTSSNAMSGYQGVWESSNLSGLPVLPYKATPGEPPPQRIEAPAPPTGYMAVGSEADADLRAAIGIRDPLADVPETQSGKAISLQISQGNIGTYQFFASLKSVIRYCATDLVELIPYYYNYEHIRMIMGNDGNVTAVQIKQQYEENGKQVMHDLAQGKYSVVLSEGADYETQRQEALERILEFVKADPEMMKMYGDIIFNLQDWKGSEEAAARARTLVPPNALAASNASNGDDPAASAQAQAMQLQQQNQQLQQALQQLQQTVQRLDQEQKAKLIEINAKSQADLHMRQLEFQHEIKLKEMDIQGKGTNIAQKGVVDTDLIIQQGDVDQRLTILEGHTDVFHRNMDHELKLQAGAQVPKGAI